MAQFKAVCGIVKKSSILYVMGRGNKYRLGVKNQYFNYSTMSIANYIFVIKMKRFSDC